MSPGLRSSTFCAAGARMRKVTRRSEPACGDVTAGTWDPRPCPGAWAAGDAVADADCCCATPPTDAMRQTLAIPKLIVADFMVRSVEVLVATVATRACYSKTNVSRAIGLPTDPLDRDVLCRQHLVLQREHARGRFVDAADEGDRSLEDRFDALAILDARLRVLMLHDEVRVGHVELQQIPLRELMYDPVDGPALEARYPV